MQDSFDENHQVTTTALVNDSFDQSPSPITVVNEELLNFSNFADEKVDNCKKKDGTDLDGRSFTDLIIGDQFPASSDKSPGQVETVNTNVEDLLSPSPDDSFESIPDSVAEGHSPEVDSFDESPIIVAKDDLSVKQKLPIHFRDSEPVDAKRIDQKEVPLLENSSCAESLLEKPPIEPEPSTSTLQEEPEKTWLSQSTWPSQDCPDRVEEIDSFDESPVKTFKHDIRDSAQRNQISDLSDFKQKETSVKYEGFMRASGTKIVIDPKLLEESRKMLNMTEGENLDPAAGDFMRFESPLLKRKIDEFNPSSLGFSPARTFSSPNPISAKRGRLSTSAFRSPIVRSEIATSVNSPKLGLPEPKIEDENTLLPKHLVVTNPQVPTIHEVCKISPESFYLLHELRKNTTTKKAVIKVQIRKFINKPAEMFYEVCKRCKVEMRPNQKCPKCQGAEIQFHYRFEAELCDSSITSIQCKFDDKAGKQLFGEDADEKQKLFSTDIDKWYDDLHSLRGRDLLIELNVLRNPKRTIYIVREISQDVDFFAIQRVLKEKISMG